MQTFHAYIISKSPSSESEQSMFVGCYQIYTNYTTGDFPLMGPLWSYLIHLGGLIHKSTYVAMYIWVQFYAKLRQAIFFVKLKKKVRTNVILDIFTFSPLQRPRGISQNVSGLYNVRICADYKIHICAKLYCLGRAKVLSSVATDFGPSTKRFPPVKCLLIAFECRNRLLSYS